MANSGIYCITNIVNGHKYIGSAVNIMRRWQLHKSNLKKNKHHSPYLQNAWNKYGPDNFEFSIIERCDIELLIKREQFYIDCEKPIYNICPLAGSRLGSKASDETKRKVSEARLRTKVPSGECHYRFGKHCSDETKRKISEANFGRKLSDEQNRKKAEAQTGLKRSDETKRRMSEAQKLRYAEVH